MLEIDRWALARKGMLVQKCLKGYEDYQFHQVYSALYNFCTVEMSAFYLDILKDRLYTCATHSKGAALGPDCIMGIARCLYASGRPILSFTSEEVITRCMRAAPREASPSPCMFCCFQNMRPLGMKSTCWRNGRSSREVREAVFEIAGGSQTDRVDRNSLEAKVVLRISGEAAALLRRHESDLRYIFIVSQVALEDNPGKDGDLRIEVFKKPMAKNANAAGIIPLKWRRTAAIQLFANAVIRQVKEFFELTIYDLKTDVKSSIVNRQLHRYYDKKPILPGYHTRTPHRLCYEMGCAGETGSELAC